MRIWKEMKFLVFLGINSIILQILQCIVIAGPARRSSRMIREVYPEIETEKNDANTAEVCIVGDVVYGAEEPVPADQPCLKCKCEPPGVQCESTRCIKKPGCKAIHKPNECCPEYQCECEQRGRIYANGERLETPAGGECKVCYCRGGEPQCAEVSCYIRTDCEGRTVPGQCCPKYDHCPPREPIFDRVPYTTPSMIGNNFDLLSSNLFIENPLTTSVNSIQNDDASVQVVSEEDAPKITIQEIIPDIKEIPITGPPKREISQLTHGQDLEGKNIHRFHSSKDDVSDTETESSEISEIYHQPPPILKIGDQLLVLKKGELIPKKDISTPRPVITVIGAEGLQRGTEDSGETHETSRSNSTEVPTVSDASVVLTQESGNVQATTASIEDVVVNVTDAQSDFENTTLMAESITAKVETTTNDYANETVGTLAPLVEDQNMSTILEKLDEEASTPYTDSSVQITTHLSKSKHEDEVLAEQNPEYPPIPDIMSPQNLDEDSDLPQADELSVNHTEHSLISTKASLPSITLDAVAPTDLTQDEDHAKASAEIDKSKETVEASVSEESGEFTTPPSGHAAPMFSAEDASVESTTSNTSSELFEMLNVTENATVLEDVEIVDSQLLSEDNGKKITYEKHSEVITKELDNRDVKTTPSNDNKPINEDAEAEAIFRELLEEATSSMPPQHVGSVKNREKESALLHRVSAAIMKYQAKESKESLDDSILGILRDFFNSQSKHYENKN